MNEKYSQTIQQYKGEVKSERLAKIFRLTKDTRTQGYTAPESGVWVGGKRLVPIHRVKGPLCFRQTARVINRVGRTGSA